MDALEKHLPARAPKPVVPKRNPHRQPFELDAYRRHSRHASGRAPRIGPALTLNMASRNQPLLPVKAAQGEGLGLTSSHLEPGFRKSGYEQVAALQWVQRLQSSSEVGFMCHKSALVWALAGILWHAPDHLARTLLSTPEGQLVDNPPCKPRHTKTAEAAFFGQQAVTVSGL